MQPHRSIRLTLVLALLLPACGPGNKTGPARAGVGSRPTVEELRLQEWEMYPAAAGEMPEVSGAILGPGGEPAAGATATIVLKPREGIVGDPKRVRSVEVGEDGRFSFENVPENSWIQAGQEGFAGSGVMALDLMSEPAEGRVLPLSETGSIEGNVVFDDGSPVAGQRVAATGGNSGWLGIAETDAEGGFRIDAAPVGGAMLSLLPGVGATPPIGVNVNPGETTPIEIRARKVPPLIGKVVDEQKKPVAGAFVSYFADGEKILVTDERGAFRIDGFTQPQAVVRAPGFGEVEIFLNPERNEPDEIEIVLPDGGVASGRVVDGNGKPLAGVRVSAVIDPGRASHVTRGPLTREDGSFEISWIPLHDDGNEVVVLVEGPGLLPGMSEAVHLMKRQRMDGIELSPAPPSGVTMRIVDDDGNPLPGMWVIVEAENANVPVGLRERLFTRAVVRADEEGRVRLNRLRAGPYRLLAQSETHFRHQDRIDVPKGVVTDLGNLTVPRKLALGGTLKSSAGTELENAHVLVVRPGTNFRFEVAAKEDGSFLLTGLDEGEYLLRARARMHDEAMQTAKAGEEDIEMVLPALGLLHVELLFPDDYEGETRIEIAAERGPPTVQAPVRRKLDAGKTTLRLARMPVGGYRIRAKSGSYVALEDFQIAAGPPVVVDLDFALGGTVTGTLRDSEGKPVPEVAVDLQASDGWGRHAVTTDEEGKFRFDAVYPGAVTLRSQPKGYALVQSSAEAVAGEETSVDLSLPAGAEIEVTVVDGAEQPIEGAGVGVTDGDGTPVPFWIEGGGGAKTGPDGKVRLTGLPAGKCMITAAVGSKTGSGEADLEAGGSTAVKITIER